MPHLIIGLTWQWILLFHQKIWKAVEALFHSMKQCISKEVGESVLNVACVCLVNKAPNNSLVNVNHCSKGMAPGGKTYSCLLLNERWKMYPDGFATWQYQKPSVRL